MLIIYILLSLSAPLFAPFHADSGPAALSFEQELVLGSEDEDHLLFSATTFFTVAPNGRIAILDAGNKRVLLFTEEGEFVTSTGSEGQGPGEFVSPSEITSDTKGNFYVFDAQALKVNIFDNDGAFVKTLRMPRGIVGLAQPSILSNGNIVLSNVKLDQNGQQVYHLSLFDADMKLIKQLQTTPQPALDWSRSGSPDFWVEFLVGHLEGLGRGMPLSATTQSGFVTMLSNQYEGQFWNVNGQQLGQFSRESRPVIMSEAMKENQCESIYQKVVASGQVAQFLPYSVYTKAMRKAQLPDTINPISQLFPTQSGFGVLVSFDTIKQSGQVELFDHQGTFLRSGVFMGPASSMKWFDNKLYTMGETSDGLQVFSRYKVVTSPGT